MDAPETGGQAMPDSTTTTTTTTATTTTAMPIEGSRPEPLAERVVISAMAVNPLVAMDRSQLLAAAYRPLVRAVFEPRVLGRRVAALGRELWEVAQGTSERAPEASDRRFADPAFRDHPVYRRVMQGYLAWRHAVHALVD